MIATNQVRETSRARSHTKDMANVADSPTDDDQGKAEDRAEGKPGDRPDRGQPAQGPSLVRMLLFSGLVALICGVVGGWGASVFASRRDGKKPSDKQAAPNKSLDSSTRKPASDATRPAEPDTLRKQTEDLAKRVDTLVERFDSLTLPRDQTPPEIRKLQVKVIDLAHAVERMGDPPAQFRHVEDRLEELHQQLKTLQSNITGHPENAKGSATPAARPSTAPSADAPSGRVTSDS